MKYTADNYKPGDRVIVKSKEELKEIYLSIKVDLGGQVVTIDKLTTNGMGDPGYKIKEDPGNYVWFDRDFERLDKKEKKESKAETVLFDNQVMGLERDIIKVIYSDPATIMFYKDHQGNTKKVVSVCDESDVYDRQVGLEICILKAIQREVSKELKKYTK